jgi:hypothetical protein
MRERCRASLVRRAGAGGRLNAIVEERVHPGSIDPSGSSNAVSQVKNSLNRRRNRRPGAEGKGCGSEHSWMPKCPTSWISRQY